MAFQEVIKYEGTNDILIYKYPEEDFSTFSQLIVHESQEAVFFSDGHALDTFKAGRYTLETKNIPLISSLRNLASGGESPFHCEVYFINMVTMMDVLWGTPSQVTVKDPAYGYSYSVGASGTFGLRVTDGRKLLINTVGTETEFNKGNVQKYFKDLIVTRVKSYISAELGKYSYNTINQYLNEISEHILQQINQNMLEFGIELLNFFVSAININPDDLEQLKSLDNSMAQKRFEAMGNRDATVIEAEGAARARELQGYTWQQEQQFDVSKTFAQNEGFAGNPANMMAQIPLAFSMGNMMADNMQSSVQAGMASAGGTQTAPIADGNNNNSNNTGGICGSCGSPLMDGARFCSQCGTPVPENKKTFCTNCGRELLENEKFCSQCGTRRS